MCMCPCGGCWWEDEGSWSPSCSCHTCNYTHTDAKKGAHVWSHIHMTLNSQLNANGDKQGEKNNEGDRGTRSRSERMCKWNRWSGNKCIVITSFKQRLALWGPWLPLPSLSHSFDWENGQKDGPKGHALSLSISLSLPCQETKLYRIVLSSLIIERNSMLVITWRQQVVWWLLMNDLIPTRVGSDHNACGLS